MFKIFTTVIIVLIVSMVLYLKWPQEDQSLAPTPTPLLNSELESYIKTTQVNYGERDYTVYWFNSKSVKEVELIPNFSEKINSKTAFSQNTCDFLVNAGFYTKEGTPTGLFTTPTGNLRKWSNNTLFNGVLFQGQSEGFDISSKLPEDETIWSVQTGPILIDSAKEKVLNINNDKYARRTVAFITNENDLSFLIIFDKQTVFSGPLLSDLPRLLTLIKNKENIPIIKAINMDGGTASAFVTHSLSISEAMPVGAFFCFKVD